MPSPVTRIGPAASLVEKVGSTGKLTMNIIIAVAEFERDLLVERTQAGLSRAKAEGKVLGRPPSLADDQRRAVKLRLVTGPKDPYPPWRHGPPKPPVAPPPECDRRRCATRCRRRPVSLPAPCQPSFCQSAERAPQFQVGAGWQPQS